MADMQPSADESGDTGAVGEAPTGSAAPSGMSKRAVPAAVTKRFLRLEDRYFYPDHSLAFIDSGNRLKVRTDNSDVVPSIVAIVQARGWKSIRLTGTQAFRQQMWQEATLQGIDVHGYEPSELERLQMQRATAEREQLHKSQQQPSDAASDTNSTRSEATPNRQNPRNRSSAPTVGLLLDHGAAPYQFDPQRGMSYYVRLKTEAGERTLWGNDLERALAESRSGARVGDTVVLHQRGVQPVTIRVPDPEAQDGSIGEKKFVTHRLVWSVETTQYVEALNRKATMFRNPQVKQEDLLSEYPDLAGAVGVLKLGEQFAKRLTPHADDQARMVQAIRNRLADAIAQGQEINLPQQRLRASHIHQRARSAPTREDPVRSRG